MQLIIKHTEQRQAGHRLGKIIIGIIALFSIAACADKGPAPISSDNTYLKVTVPYAGPVEFSDPSFADHGPNDENVASVEKGNIEFVKIGIPKLFPGGSEEENRKHEALVAIFESISGDRSPEEIPPHDIKAIEVLIFVEGTKWGTGCFWYNAMWHCHPHS